jgi:hypothetical protein
MKAYKRLSKDSGITHYDILPEGIIVQFNDGKTYLYTFRSAGKKAIARMKTLAAAGKGLSTFINVHVREKYESRIR